VPRQLLTALVYTALLIAGFGALAQDDPPPLDPDDIVIPNLPGEQEPSFEPEDSVAACSDEIDNDDDGHVDCDDQDCEVFAICVERPAAAPVTEPPEPTPKPTKVPEGYERAESSRMRALKIAGHATLWPGLGIAVLTTAFRFSDESDYCDEGDSDALGVCSGWGWAVGGALVATGAVLLSIYYVKRKRIAENNPDLALSVAPLVGEGLYGVGGVAVF